MDGPVMLEQEPAHQGKSKKKRRFPCPRCHKKQSSSENAICTRCTSETPQGESRADVEPLPNGAKDSSLKERCACCHAAWSGVNGNLTQTDAQTGQYEPIYHRSFRAREFSGPMPQIRRVIEEDRSSKFFGELVWDVWPVATTRAVPSFTEREQKKEGKWFALPITEIWICAGCWVNAENIGLRELLERWEEHRERDQDRYHGDRKLRAEDSIRLQTVNVRPAPDGYGQVGELSEIHYRDAQYDMAPEDEESLKREIEEAK